MTTTPVSEDREGADVASVVANAPHPSTWSAEKLAELQRLIVPLVKAVQHEEDGP